MRTPGMLLVALVILCSTAYAQEAGAPDGAIVKSAQVSGLSFDRLVETHMGFFPVEEPNQLLAEGIG